MAKKENKISRFWRRLFIRRKYKDLLFQRVFADKKDLLTLYNALNGTHYTNPEDLQITTLEDVIYMSMKNDLSFILSYTLNLYEHQSTFNPNMPIRGVLYFAKLYEAYIKLNNYDIYGGKMIRLPLPQYIVFYNGREEQPDEKILRLSDSFYPIKEGFSPVLECEVKVLNINYGHNKEIMELCKKLHDYSYFINEVYKNVDANMPKEDAVEKAIDDCIEKNILRDILEKQRSEVYSMLLFTYDEKLHKKTIRQEAIEEGLAEGRAEAMAHGVSQIVMLYKSGDLNRQVTINTLVNGYGMSEKEAIEKIDN